MEQGILAIVSLLPLGLVAVCAYIMLTRKKKQSPKLKLVETPDVKKIQALGSRMSQLNAESQRDEDADQSGVEVVSTKPRKARKNKKRKPTGKRK